MGAAENRAVHTRMTEAENRHDLSQHEDYFHEDIVVYPLGADPVIGIAAYRASMEAQFALIPDWHVVLEDQFATDDRVAYRWLVTGQQIQYAGASLWEFEDGKARRGWTYVDMPDLMARLQAQT
jgi:predicted ester cyclase